MLNAIAALFNIQRGEGRLLSLLLGVSFCLGLTRLFTQTAAGTLFLVMFGVEPLPFVYISVAVVMPLIGLIYDRIAGRLALPLLLLANLSVMAAVLAVLWLSTTLTDARWPAFALAVWYEVVWAMTSLCLWGLASRLLNVRQGKRLFGLISAGDVLAATIGGLLTPILVNLFGTPSLLLGALGGLGGAALLVHLTTRWFAESLAATTTETPEERGNPAASPVQRRYMAVVLILAMLCYAGFYVIDNIFYGQVEARYPAENELASFLGVFWAAVNALTLICNLVLVSPLFNRYGVRAGLLVLPIVTGVPALVLALGGSFFALPAFVFWMVVTINMLDWVFSETIQKAGLLILYQPLPALQRLRLQTRVESIGQPVAAGLAGLTLLGLELLRLGVLQRTWILVAILLACIALSVVVGHSYVHMLLQAIAWRRFGKGALALTDSDSVALMLQALSSEHPGTVIYALDMLESIGHPALAAGLQRILTHPAREVRREALARIERLGLIAALDDVRQLAASDPDAYVRGAAVRALAALDGGAFDELAPELEAHEPEVRLGALVGLLRSGGLAGMLPAGERLLRMAQSREPNERALAAQVLGEVGVQQFYRPLIGLLGDPELSVRRAAIEAAGKLRNARLASLLLGALAERDTHTQAAAALAACGDPVVPELATALEQPNLPLPVVLRILRVAGHIGGARAIVVLKLAAGGPDGDVRHQALLALNRCGFRADGAHHDQFQRVLQIEIAEIATLLGIQVDLAGSTDCVAWTLLASALQEAVSRSRERLLLILACFYDAGAISYVRAALAHPAVARRAQAVEALDNMLANEHRPLVALFSEDQTPAQQLRRLDQSMLPRLGRDERLRAIAMSPEGHYTPWIRMCARAAAGLTPVQFDGSHNGAAAMLSLIERVLILKKVGIFAGIPDSTLAEVAALLEQQDLAAGAVLFEKGDPGRCLYIIVAGRLRVHDGGRLLNELGERDIVGEMAVLDAAPRLASVEALEETRLLRLEQDAIYELMADYVEVARGIIQVLSSHLRARVQDVVDLRARLKESEAAAVPAHALGILAAPEH